MSKNDATPRIVRRKKVVEGGHHGGAWKVAYADFVTAMMAFFLLMWLLGATNENQRKGIADYFNPTIPIHKMSGGGNGAFGGDTVFSENTLTQQGAGGTSLRPAESQSTESSIGGEGKADKAEIKQETAKMAALKKAFSGFGGESMVSELMARHIISHLTDEGLIVELFELPEARLFKDDGRPTARFDELLGVVVDVFNLVENNIAIRAHVAARPIVAVAENPWTLSSARADMTRERLQGRGLDHQRLRRVTGAADSALVTEDPFAVRNNRVEVILLRNQL